MFTDVTKDFVQREVLFEPLSYNYVYPASTFSDISATATQSIEFAQEIRACKHFYTRLEHNRAEWAQMVIKRDQEHNQYI